MNKVILMGRLARDPEMRQTPTGSTVARLTIAVNRRFSRDNEQTADFISCVAWNQTAEFICKYFRKGSMIAITGRIQTRSWDGQDGKKQYATDVVIEEAYFTGSKTETGTRGNQDYGMPQQYGRNDYNAGGYTQSYALQNQGFAPQNDFGQPYPQDNYNQGGYNQGMPQFDTNPDGSVKPNFDDFEGAGFSAADGSEDDLPF